MPSECFSALPGGLRFIFHGNAEARAAACVAWGVGFAEQACRALRAGPRATLWLGPDEYLLLDGTADANPAASTLAASAVEQALGALPHALVDISHRQIALSLSGPHAAQILSGACPLDLSLAEFPVGACPRTAFAKADIVLWRTAAEAFHLEVWRSYRAYVSDLLREIALDFEAPG